LIILSTTATTATTTTSATTTTTTTSTASTITSIVLRSVRRLLNIYEDLFFLNLIFWLLFMTLKYVLERYTWVTYIVRYTLPTKYESSSFSNTTDSFHWLSLEPSFALRTSGSWRGLDLRSAKYSSNVLVLSSASWLPKRRVSSGASGSLEFRVSWALKNNNNN
jgi:hypothetical protein